MAMTATSPSPEISFNRYGLTQVYAPTGPANVDIVFVHGLNGAPDKTWTSEKSKIFWPSQLLPTFLADQNARVLVYGYDADVVSFTDGASRDRIHNHAETLVQSLANNRDLYGAMERPIIFVTHSLGGLVVKRALISSSEVRGKRTEYLRSIFVSTCGVLFLGTPHLGSNLAKWGSLLEGICGAVLPSKVMDSEPQLVESLKKNNEVLQNIDRQFVQLASRLNIFFFHEGKKTNLRGTLQFVVDEESAAPNIQDVERSVIQQDHSHMCKFENVGATGFEMVAGALRRYCRQAPDRATRNWKSEKAEQMVIKQAEVQDIFSGENVPGSLKESPNSEQLGATSSRSRTPDTSQILPPKDSPVPSRTDMKDSMTNTDQASSSSRSSEPYFIVPPGLRPNSFFVGMDKEFRELDRRLFDHRRRDGTACVLLHGQPGGGKTHLARQYIHKQKAKFPGGIFWITSKSKEEMFHSFWDIKQKVVARDSAELCEKASSNDFVPIVKQWFEGRKDWLIVYDGLVLEKDEEASELADFIPDSKDSSIIYISRQKNLASKQRFLRPSPIKVGPLKEDDAKKLLFKVLGKKKPTDAEQKKATELVKKIGGLPLAIDAISHRLADTQEPLTKFKLSYFSDPTLEGTYSSILNDLQRLGHNEAWNLIHILCWFGHRIPVEMVHLGIRSLRADNIEVKSGGEVGKPDLNTTFGTLIRYALLERNELDSDKDSMSSSRESLTESIDMLRIHSVVQSFCCDSLNAKQKSRDWLGYAIKLFRYAFHQADRKIKERPDAGAVGDYRYFLVHGQHLWDHTVHYQSSRQSMEDLRIELRPIIEKIHTEIRLREPNSSQESLRSGAFQVSIFDRTSSSSSSGPPIPGVVTPNSRPTPPPLPNESLYGFPLEKEQTDSPRSLGTASPGFPPNILNGSPHLRQFENDGGYDSDREGHPRGHSMRPNRSESTARPYSRSRATTTESQKSGWQLVPSGRKSRNRRRRRDLGSFRPSGARPKVDRKTVFSDQARNNDGRIHRRESSPAFRSLEKAQSGSPSPPIQTRVKSFFQRRFSGSPTKPNMPEQPTWAKVAAGNSGSTKAAAPSANVSQNRRPKIERGRSRDSLRGLQGNMQASSGSPLASEFVPHSGQAHTLSRTSSRTDSPYQRPSQREPTGSRSNSSQRENMQPQALINKSTQYYTPPQLGPNSAPLPVDANTSISIAPYPSGPDPRYGRTPQTAFLPFAPQNGPQIQSGASFAYQQTSFAVPTGYTSQPMSRDHSHQSHISVAETEPLHSYPSFSPYVGSYVGSNSAPLRHYSSTHFHQPGDGSPRERDADGRPLRKSPRTEYAVPATPRRSSQNSFHSTDHSPPQAEYSTAVAHSASRHSRTPSGGSQGRGPGIAIMDPLTGKNAGHIVGFGASPHLPDSPPQSNYTFAQPPPVPSLPTASSSGYGQLQFGEHAPISLEEARRRTFEAEERLRLLTEAKRIEDEERERRNLERRVARAYPDVNLIPTVSENEGILEEMVHSGEMQRHVGLGVRNVSFDQRGGDRR